jgi:two-component system, LuxR family, sensor kinase FixL
MTRTVSFLLVSAVVGISLFTMNALGATNSSPKRVLILDSFGRDVAPFNAAASAFRTTLARELGEPVDFYQDRLPLGSIVQFRQPTIWERYKWSIILVLGLCVLEAVLISVLLRERRRRRLVQQKVEEHLRFEQLVSELSNKFINLSSEDVEDEIVSALGQVARLLRFDIAALSIFTGQDGQGRVAYICRAEGVPEIPSGLTDRDFPWSAEELFAGRDVCLRSLEMLPLAARTDRATYEKYHVRSSYNVPMVTGGRVIGVLGFNTVWEEREIPSELLQGQRLLGGIFANALARKAAEESLRESEENLRNLVETTAAVPWQADVETWVFTYVGPQAVKLLGYPLEQWYQKDFWVSHLHPDDKEFAIDTCLTNCEKTEDFAFEYRMIAASGKSVWVHDIVKCEHRNGKPVQLRGFMLDISERKQAEEALRESEERFHNMADSAPVMIWMSGTDKRCTFFNKGWLDFTGRTLEQELGNGWAEGGVHREDFDRCLEIYSNAFNARQEFTMEYRLRRCDGEYCWVLDHGVPRFGPDNTFLGYIGSVIDITERERAAEALESQRAFLRQVIDSNPNFMFAKDREGRFTLVNRAVADVYGTTVENLIGKTDADFNPNREEVEFFHRMDLEVLNTLQERFIPEEQITDAQGKTRWLQTVKRPIIEKDGTANQVLGASTDITRRKETESELRRQRENLAHVTRISAMGELAASLAHELNQPLTAILSNAQAAQRFMAASPADLEEVHEILKDIVRDNIRASEVIRRMRALVKKEELESAPLDLATLIQDIVLMVHSDAILNNIGVLLELNPGLPMVRGDKVQLQQVLLNLLLNAFDAMKDCPAIQREVVIEAGQNGGRMVEVAIRDRGTGLTSDKLEKIFQPFYSTKRDGLGMGLSICRTIIEAHGGRLWAANNKPDRGATFCFTVPVEKRDEGRGASDV